MAAPLVTENWSDYEYVPGKGARRGFVITGVRNAREAVAALQNQKGVAFASSHELDARLGAEDPVISTRKGPNYYEAQVNYIPKGQLGPGGGNLLDSAIRWSWRSAPREESTDLDASNPPLAILNTAGQPFQSDITRAFNAHILIARRYESSYRSGVADDFMGSVNKKQVKAERVGIFAPGQLKLVSYEPEGEYPSEPPAGNGATPQFAELPTVYQFEVRKGNKKDADGVWDGFKFRIRNEGFMGWYSDGSGENAKTVKGDFVTTKGERVSEPVLLDKEGKPLDKEIKVMAESGTTKDPVAAPGKKLEGKYIEETAAKVVFLKYLKCPLLDFKGLALFK